MSGSMLPEITVYSSVNVQSGYAYITKSHASGFMSGEQIVKFLTIYILSFVIPDFHTFFTQTAKFFAKYKLA
mgnify:CR=1 FL=1